jgi:glycosyltransferase involved in cell wall biosynthesis
MKKSNVSITLVIPCYNGSTNIQQGVLDKIGNFTKDDERFIEVIIVDDGSTDNSRELITTEYLPLFKKFRLIKAAHQGKGFSVIRGMSEAKGGYVMFSDIDLATPIEEANKLITEVENGYDVVIGSRKSNRKGAPLMRKILSFGSVLVRDYFMGLKGIRDTQCGFKLFKTKATEEIIKRLQVYKKPANAVGASVSAGFDMEFLFIAVRLGYKIKEVPVIWRHVETRNVSFIKDAKEALRDILTIKWNELHHKYDFSVGKKN